MRLGIRPLAATARRAALFGAKATAATALAAAGTVAYCESSTKTEVPKFSLGGDRYDQSTFQGRLTKIQEMIDIRTVFTTDEELAACQGLLAEFKTRGSLPAGKTDADMWEAQRIVDAVVHGPTGEVMFIPGRMSMFVPMNLPATAGMIMARSTPAILFFQWMNQTYNVINNYVCRAGPEVELVPLAQSYALAVAASCSIAIGAGKLLKAYPSLQAFGLFVPYFAVISAGTCNVALTRMDEIRNGIDVADEDGKALGRSVQAGRQAVWQTVTTRSLFIPFCSLCFPPIIMKGVFATGVITAGTGGAVVLELGAITAMLAFGLPIALAIQPLQMALDVATLEPQFRDLKKADGSPVTTVYASKGM